MPDGELMLLADAAARMNTTPDAVRQRIKRGTLRGVKGNDGRMRVFVPADQLRPDAVQTRPTTDRLVVQLDDRPNDRPPDQTELVAELRRQIERLEAELLRQDGLHRAERERLLVMLERATTPRLGIFERLAMWLHKKE